MTTTRTNGQISDGNPQALPQVGISVSDDRLTAYFSVRNMPEGQALSAEAVNGFLAEKGIVYGICTGEIQRYCAGRNYAQPLLCAKGNPAEDEKDAKMKYLFRTERSGAPTERADGTVDYRNLEIVQNVTKGDVLCRILPPPCGKNGTDVYGHSIPFRKCRLPLFPKGMNTLISKDRLELSAAIDGCIDYRKDAFHQDILNINQIYVIKGDVDYSCGNIDFIGTVVVRGDVLKSFSVKAGGDISVYGMVEGATLQAAGNIMIASGVNGLSGGSISAGGNVKSKYIQNAVVRCGGNIYADVLMNSNVKARQSVLLRGRKSAIIGGECCAGKQVYAKTIGTENNLKTSVTVDSPELIRALTGVSANRTQVDRLNGEIEKEHVNQRELHEKLEAAKLLSARYKHPSTITAFMDTLLQKIRSSEKLEENSKNQIEKLQAMPLESVADFNVIGYGTIFAGTKVTIGSENTTLNSDYSRMKFYMSDGKIVSGPLLPSDEKFL